MQWVQNNPFRMAALVEHVDYIRPPSGVASVEQYRDAGMNYMAAWSNTYLGIGTAAKEGNMPWSVQSAPGRPLQQFVDFNARYALSGIQVGDEPGFMQLPEYGAKVAELKTAFPNALVWSNALPSYSRQQDLWDRTGNTTPPPGYSWSQYVDDYIAAIRPDVMMWDYYPYARSPLPGVIPPQRIKPAWFSDMMTIRQKSQAAGLPYWGFVQSGYEVDWGRTPSESDMRMNMFSMLTTGFSGMEHFVYRATPFDGLIRADRTTTPLYDYSATASVAVTNLGNVTKNLRSSDVRFVPGGLAGTNPTPAGLTNWSQGAGGDSLIQRIEVLDIGAAKDGLVGYFTDDAGRQFLMLTNLYQDYNLTAEQAQVRFEIEFDDSITEVLRTNPQTGLSELVPLQDNMLSLDLLGGTGELFQYTAIPEPGHLALAAAALLPLVGRPRNGGRHGTPLNRSC